jgi:hypothetical protein
LDFTQITRQEEEGRNIVTMTRCPRCLFAVYGDAPFFIAHEAFMSTAISHDYTAEELWAEIHAEHGGT